MGTKAAKKVDRQTEHLNLIRLLTRTNRKVANVGQITGKAEKILISRYGLREFEAIGALQCLSEELIA